jgi:hypothetical protein
MSKTKRTPNKKEHRLHHIESGKNGSKTSSTLLNPEQLKRSPDQKLIHDAKNDSEGAYNRRLIRCMLLVNFVTLVCLIASTIFVWLQFREMRTANQITSKVSNAMIESANRAWVTVKDITHGPTVPQMQNVDVTIDNTGHSPAFGTLLACCSVQPSTSPEPSLSIDTPEKFHSLAQKIGASHFVIGPGHSHVISIPLPALQKENVTAIMDGKLTLFLLGRIEYEDGFGNPRFTTFCDSYLLDGNWKQCSGGNTAK